jgi:PKD repeat protein
MNMDKIKFTSLVLLIMLAAPASLSAAITYSPPAPKTGQNVTFTLSPSGASTSTVNWNFGDGSPVQTNANLTMTHVYAAVGSYTVSAGYPTMSHYQVDQATVTVTDPRQISYSPLQPKAGQAVVFTAQNFFSSCIRWDFGDATIKNGAAAESHTYAAAGSYTVRAYEECGATYGAAVMVTVAKADEKPPDEEPPPVTPGQPVLAVSIVSLYFAGGKTDVSVAKDSAGLQAFADIQVKGTGILQWQWLVDGMAIKSETLAVSFDNKYTLESGQVPGLPTTVPGHHQVTLRFQNPETDFAIPVITYFVTLRGPTPVVIKVTPATLAPGAEYTLELEGAELTPDTEIIFPAPLALLKKAAILSPTQAQAVVFVAPTALAGTKTVSAKNEYGRSDGPATVNITPLLKFPSSSAPGFKEAPKSSPEDLLKKLPAISGTIQCVPQFTKTGVEYYAMAWIFLTRGSQPISGAVVKVDGTVIPAFANPAGGYKGYAPKLVKVGRSFKVEVTIAGVAHTGSGGRVDTIVTLTKPARGEAWRYKEDGPLDCRWTFSNGVRTVNLHAQLESASGALLNVIYDKNMAADHASIPVPVISDPKGKVFITLTRRFSDIQLDGEWAPGSKIEVSQFYGYGFKLSEAVFGKDSTPQPGMPPTGTEPNPPLQANVPEPANPAPPYSFCADIAVASLKASLVSTQLNDPAVDFPHDKVRLEMVIENRGNKNLPSPLLIDRMIKKNGQLLYACSGMFSIESADFGKPGSRYVMDNIVDTFPHGVATTYSAEVLPIGGECSNDNNNASLTIDETQLHPKAKHVPSQEQTETTPMASELSHIAVTTISTAQAPFIVTSETLTVTGKTPPPVPTGPFTPVAVTTETLTVMGKTQPDAPASPFTPVSVTTATLTVTGKSPPPPPSTPFTPVTVTTEPLTVTGKTGQ